MLKSLSSLSLSLVNILAIETKQLDKTTYVLYVLMDKANCDWEKELERRRNKKIPYTENELIEIIQHFCIWLFRNEYTKSKLSLAQ